MELTIVRNREELAKLEEVIQRNIGAFYEVGRALMEIRDKGLYKDVLGFDTFEAYCKERWDFSRRHAYRFIEAVEVIENVSESDTKHPINLEQTRPLAHLDADQQRIAWKQAVETAPEGKVTAAHVYKIVKGMTEPDHKPKTIISKDDDLMSPEFKKAWEELFTQLKDAKALKWRTTAKAAAIKHIQVLMNVATI